MESQSIHPHDLEVIAALKAGDPSVTRQFFYEELSGLLETIRHKYLTAGWTMTSWSASSI